MWRNDISGPDGCRGMTYSDQIHVEESHIQTRWVWKNDRSRSDGCGGMTYQEDMSFLHMHLVRICHSVTYIWSRYVIPSHVSGPDMSFLHIHLVMTDPDQMDVEE
jgi:hypothetical protein